MNSRAKGKAGGPEDLQRRLDQLKAERDQARRMACRSAARVEVLVKPQDLAKRLGWDCFKGYGQ
jgi:hypothetical protein